MLWSGTPLVEGAPHLVVMLLLFYFGAHILGSCLHIYPNTCPVVLGTLSLIPSCFSPTWVFWLPFQLPRWMSIPIPISPCFIFQPILRPSAIGPVYFKTHLIVCEQFCLGLAYCLLFGGTRHLIVWYLSSGSPLNLDTSPYSPCAPMAKTLIVLLLSRAL